MTIKGTQCSENETDGMVFSRQITSLHLVNREAMLDDEAAFLDYADCTDRSSKIPLGRSPTIVQPTEQAMYEGNLTSYRNEDRVVSQDRMGDVSAFADRPFDK